MKASAGDRLEQVEHPLPVAQGEEQRGGRSQFEWIGGIENQVGGNAGHLGQDQTDVLGSFGNLELQEALGGDDERDLVGVAGDPVDPIDQGRYLGIGAHLGDLLVATVHVSDHRLHVGGPLAVDLGDEPENPVGRGVLGPDVEGHVGGLPTRP